MGGRGSSEGRHRGRRARRQLGVGGARRRPCVEPGRLLRHARGRPTPGGGSPHVQPVAHDRGPARLAVVRLYFGGRAGENRNGARAETLAPSAFWLARPAGLEPTTFGSAVRVGSLHVDHSVGGECVPVRLPAVPGLLSVAQFRRVSMGAFALYLHAGLPSQRVAFTAGARSTLLAVAGFNQLVGLRDLFDRRLRAGN